MMGIPVPKDMDGRVLGEIFRQDSPLADKEVTYVHTSAEVAKEKERIRKVLRERV